MVLTYQYVITYMVVWCRLVRWREAELIVNWIFAVIVRRITTISE